MRPVLHAKADREPPYCEGYGRVARGREGLRTTRYVPLMHRGVVVVVVVIVVVVVPSPARIWTTDHPASERASERAAAACVRYRQFSQSYPFQRIFLRPFPPPPLHPSADAFRPSAAADAGCRRERRDATCARSPLHAMQKSLHRDGISHPGERKLFWEYFYFYDSHN